MARELVLAMAEDADPDLVMLEPADLSARTAAAQAVAESDMSSALSHGVDWKVVHSAIRWNKPIEEITQIITSPYHANSVDTKNGNYPIHIAAQNGHIELVTWLACAGARLNVQNGTGQTPLHMSMSYDYGEVVGYLLSQRADGSVRNWNGFPAVWGIDGDKNPRDPLNKFEACKTTFEALAALLLLTIKADKENHGGLEKGKVAGVGMAVKKGTKGLPKEMWTEECQKKFAALIAKL